MSPTKKWYTCNTSEMSPLDLVETVVEHAFTMDPGVDFFVLGLSS